MRSLGEITAAATTLVAAATLLSLPAPAAASPDGAPPTGSVAGFGSPASDTLELSLSASDSGWGLANAEAQLGGAAGSFVRLGSGACPEHPSQGAPEPPPGSCPASASAVPISLDTRSVADGTHHLTVLVTDAAANTATVLDRQVVVDNAPPIGLGTVATVTVGVSSEGSENSSPPSPPSKRKARCKRPRLRMRLARRPLWRTRPHHVPVLRYGRRYPYRGKLTCLAPSGKRVAAKKGTRVDVYYRVWHLTFKRSRGPVKYVHLRKIKVAKKGRLRVSLGFRSGRTILFRYRSSNGEPAKSRLRLAIPPRTRKPPWGPR